MSEIKYDHTMDEMIVFREFSSIGEAEVIKSVLESAGIKSAINNEYMSTFYPFAIAAQIVIRREDYERAKALVVD
ncbi:MAG: DUF2007 domain-containing protein [Rikenellaceae bacterium]